MVSSLPAIKFRFATHTEKNFINFRQIGYHNVIRPYDLNKGHNPYQVACLDKVTYLYFMEPSKFLLCNTAFPMKALVIVHIKAIKCASIMIGVSMNQILQVAVYLWLLVLTLNYGGGGVRGRVYNIKGLCINAQYHGCDLTASITAVNFRSVF